MATTPMPERVYDPSNHFWVVGSDTTRVYASKLGNYAQTSNPIYQAWLAAGNLPTKIPDEKALGDVLGRTINPDVRPVPSVILDLYKEGQASKLTPIDVLPKLLHFMMNEIRTLQGQPTWTFEEFRQQVKDHM